jgi:hypothetical protein
MEKERRRPLFQMPPIHRRALLKTVSLLALICREFRGERGFRLWNQLPAHLVELPFSVNQPQNQRVLRRTEIVDREQNNRRDGALADGTGNTVPHPCMFRRLFRTSVTFPAFVVASIEFTPAMLAAKMSPVARIETSANRTSLEFQITSTESRLTPPVDIPFLALPSVTLSAIRTDSLSTCAQTGH